MLTKFIQLYRNAYTGLPKSIWLLSAVMFMNRSGTMVLPYLSRNTIFNQMDDNYQDWAGGPAITNLTGGNANGRHVDDQIVSGTSTTWSNRPNYTTSKPQGASNSHERT
jgi:hypothetical protein